MYLLLQSPSSSTNAAADLLGLSTPPAPMSTGVLLDVLGDIYGAGSNVTNTPNIPQQNTYNPKK